MEITKFLEFPLWICLFGMFFIINKFIIWDFKLKKAQGKYK